MDVEFYNGKAIISERVSELVKVFDATTLHETGRIRLDHYRGRCCYPFPVQAAEHRVREATGLTGLDDLMLVAAERERGDGPASTTLSREHAGALVLVGHRDDAPQQPDAAQPGDVDGAVVAVPGVPEDLDGGGE